MTAQTAANAVAMGGTLQPLSMAIGKKSSIATISTNNYNNVQRTGVIPASNYAGNHEVIRPDTKASVFTNDSLTLTHRSIASQ